VIEALRLYARMHAGEPAKYKVERWDRLTNARSHDFAASARQNSASEADLSGADDCMVIGNIGSDHDDNALTTEVAKPHRVCLFYTSRSARTARRSMLADRAKTD
jgi:hypothetical protein